MQSHEEADCFGVVFGAGDEKQDWQMVRSHFGSRPKPLWSLDDLELRTHTWAGATRSRKVFVFVPPLVGWVLLVSPWDGVRFLGCVIRVGFPSYLGGAAWACC